MTEYWFRKRKGLFTKDLGWGWVPISAEGWILTALFIIGFILTIPKSNITFNSTVPSLFILSLFILIATKKTQ